MYITSITDHVVKHSLYRIILIKIVISKEEFHYEFKSICFPSFYGVHIKIYKKVI